MAGKVKPVPEGYHTVTPYMIVHNGADALDFYEKALGAKELMRYAAPGGKIAHAEIKIGNSHIMLADEYPEMGFKSPKMLGGTAVSMQLYVDNVDELYDRAVEAGAKVIRPVANQFYGDRSGIIEDPFGHIWNISTHVEDLTLEEMQEREKQQRKN